MSKYNGLGVSIILCNFLGSVVQKSAGGSCLKDGSLFFNN